jgi:hypothetical protein
MERSDGSTDHREDIYSARDGYTARARLAAAGQCEECAGFDLGEDCKGCGGEPTEFAYDVDILVSPTDPDRVEFLLAGGGPTIWVVVDSKWSGYAEFHHSWGMDEEGVDRRVCDLYGQDAEFWTDQAADMVEVSR